MITEHDVAAELPAGGSRPSSAVPRAHADSRWAARWPALAVAVLAAATQVLVLLQIRIPFLGPALGFWLLIIWPAYLLATTAFWGRLPAAERAVCSLAAVLLVLMLAGLGVSVLLPELGVQRPLGSVPILLMADVVTAGLALGRRRFPTTVPWRTFLAQVRAPERRLVTLASLDVVLAVLGANRLNNGLGSQVSMAALGIMAMVIALVLYWRSQIRDELATVLIYLLAAALLLMTSLRGWYVTGHDVQTEYRTFQLTLAQGAWHMSTFRSPYYACLSITILPTEIARLAPVSGPYVYKVFFQLMFAMCPVLVFTISRRYFSQPVSVLAAVYFAGFPIFFSDMPFLNRQEIAFLFAGAAVLAITNKTWSRGWRRLAFGLAAVGVEFSHYSTMYLLFGTLVVAWGIGRVGAMWRHRPGRLHRPGGRRLGLKAVPGSVDASTVLLSLAIIAVWGYLATHTIGPVLSAAESALPGMAGHGARSGDVSYGLLSGKASSPATVLGQYRTATHGSGAGSRAMARLRQAATPVVSEPDLPVTKAGRLLAGIGLPPSELNAGVRLAAAKGEQIFAIIGLIAVLAMRRYRQEVGREFCALALGAVTVVGLITALPNLSVDYGVLRAFQEALIVLAPLLAIGSIVCLRVLVRAWAAPVAAGLCLIIFCSTSGLMPQALGGYPAQLNLANSGLYYDYFYTHPQEESAVEWLSHQSGVLPNGVQAEDFTERFYFEQPPMLSARQQVTDIYPTLVRPNSWLILGWQTVRTGQATAYYDGDLITYKYPMVMLKKAKNLVYSNGGAEIYR
jgi:uncharacterized membrane protein